MLNKIFAITQFKNLWLVLPLLLAVLYVPQALWGLHIFSDKSAVQLTLILVLGLLVYLGTYLFLRRIDVVPSGLLCAGDSVQWSARYFVPGVSVIYFLLIGYVLVTAQKIALLEAFRGASQDDIAFAREALFKTREGWEKVLPYLNSIFSSALMPFALVLSYVEKKIYRHYLLFLFCLSLLPSLEKALILKAMIPLIMLALNGYFPIKRVFQFMAVSTLVIACAFMLTKSGEGNNLDENVKSLKLLQSQKAAVDKLKSDRQNVINGTGEDEISSALKELYRQKSNVEKLKRERQAVVNGKGEDEISKALKRLQEKKSDLEKLKRERPPVNLLEQERVIETQLEYYIKVDREVWAGLLEQEKIIDKQLEYYIKVDRELLPSLRQQEENIDSQMKYYQWVDSHRHKYNALGFGRVAFVINRVLWIPYVTAYDWLGYFEQSLSAQFLHGATSSLLAKIFGEQPFPMEREVFQYQFGTGGPQTAAANATFLVDAFVNFGWYGVAFYSFLLAVLIYLVTVVGNPAMQACSYYFLIQISMGGLPGVFFSNGMLLLIFLSLFIKPRRAVEAAGKTSPI